jgi:hypothetical protein
MTTIEIKIGKHEKITKKKFVMRYLFQKANGRRTVGEADVAEMFGGWLQACEKVNRAPGNAKSLSAAMWAMVGEGIVEVSRTESSSAPLPKNFYILTEEYFEFMRTGVE